MPANNHVGAKIKGLRELRSVTVEELSERCGLPVEQIQKIEAGDVATSSTTLTTPSSVSSGDEKSTPLWPFTCKSTQPIVFQSMMFKKEGVVG